MTSEGRYECEVSGALYVVLRVSQVFGKAPVRLRRMPGGWCVRISPAMTYISYVTTFIISTLCIAGSIVAEIALIEPKVYESYDHLLFLLIFLVVEVTSCVVGFTIPSRMKNFIKCLNRKQKIMKSLDNYSVKQSPKVMAAVILYLLYCILTFTIDFWDDPAKDAISVTLHCSACMQVMTIFLTIIQFALVVSEINGAMQSVNVVLSELLHDIQGDNKVKEPAAETVRKAAVTYGATCDVIEDVNKGTGCVIITSLFMCLVSIIFCDYAIIAQMAMNFERLSNAIRIINWAIFYSSLILVIIEPCHSTKCEVMRTSNLVSKLAMKYTDQSTSEELAKFQQYLHLCPASYSPMDICTLHRPLVITISASIITFLVIIIQFREVGGDSD